jgi:predicted helicase
MSIKTFTVQDLLEKFKKLSLTNRDAGNKFEVLIKNYFLTDPLYSSQIERVWLWSEFPYRQGRPDTGIDLVIKVKDLNEFWSVQCKFYSPDHLLQKSDIDTFISTSNKTFSVSNETVRFSKMVIVSTTNKWTKNAEETIINQTIPVTRITSSCCLHK